MSKKEIAVVVTTAHRGVFVGYADDPNLEAKTITLKRARMIVYYSSETHGCLGVASRGVAKGSRVSPAVAAIGLRGVTSISPAEPDAVAAWEAEPWD